jgi:murein DD-endopeptidase MepM/ murein hydrolase activator NlpD
MQLMNRSASILRKTILTAYLLAIHLLAFLFAYQNYVRPYFTQPENYTEHVFDPTEKTSVPTPLPIPSIVEMAESTPPPAEINTNQPLNNLTANQTQNNITADSPTSLMIPVVGIKREQLQDTFSASRSQGRVHNAIDIMASLGTPVVAVADGEIAKFFDSERGGITIYQYSSDKKRVYYYGHLQKRAENLSEKDYVRRGTVIGYVGDTGNSGAGNYHLHFSIAILDDPKRIFNGTEINPYPLLKDALESR